MKNPPLQHVQMVPYMTDEMKHAEFRGNANVIIFVDFCSLVSGLWIIRF